MNPAKRTFLFTLGGVVAFNVGLIGMGIWLFVGEINSRYSYIRTLQMKFDAFEQQQQSAGSIEKALEQVEPEAEKIEKAFFAYSEDSFFALTELLREMASQSNLVINLRSVDIPLQPAAGVPLTFTVSLTGKFENVMRFIMLVKNAPIFMEHGDIGFSASGNEGVVSATLTLVVGSL